MKVFEKRGSVGGVWAYSDDAVTTSTLPCEFEILLSVTKY